MKNLLFIFVIITAVLLSCGGRTGNYRILGNLRYTTSFGNGSYLVMKDSADGNIDTLFYHSIYDAIDVQNHGDYSNELLAYSFSNNFDSILKRRIFLIFNAGAESRGLGMSINYSENGVLGFASSSSPVYKEPFTIGDMYAHDSIENYYVAKYNEYEINNKAYKTVFESKQIKYTPSTNDTTVFNFLYSMHTGIIKIRMSNKNELIVLELIDSKIIR
jgi:hypothetical protein